MSVRCLDCPAIIPRGKSRCAACSRTHEAKRSARRGPSGWARQRDNATVMTHHGGRCVLCGNPAKVVDHALPLAHGGADDHANKRPLCESCDRTETRRQFRGVK